MSNSIDLLKPSAPDVYRKADIYDPTSPTSVGVIVPAVDSIVNDGGMLYTVVSVNATTYASVLSPCVIPTNFQSENGASIVSYGNDLFRLFYDNRISPAMGIPEQRIVTLGVSPSTYTLTRYPNTPQAVVISQYYDATNTLQGTNVPMLQVQSGMADWMCKPCRLSQQLTDGEQILITIYNQLGAEEAAWVVYAKHSAITNESLSYRPMITSMSLSCNQQMGPNTFFLVEDQDFSSLSIEITLTYEDGTTAVKTVDGKQTFIYGQEDLIASYAGLRQNLLAKYYLSSEEGTSPGLQVASDGYITQNFTVQVIPNNIAPSTKIAVIPTWLNSTWALRYWYYSSDRGPSKDITPYVSISSGGFSGTAYGVNQNFQIAVDMHNVDPVSYPKSAIYVQNVVVNVQPIAAFQKYTITDAASSPYVYGVDAPTSKRPIILYDSSRQQYFIPSGTFTNVTAFINSFYTQSNPPFDITKESAVPQPTHFILRDIFTGAMLTAAQIPVASYAAAFNIINDTIGKYVGSNVVVEFLNVTGTNTLVLFGVPVDCTTGTYVGGLM